MPSTQPLHEGSMRWQEREWLREQPEEWWDDVLDRIACGVTPRVIAKEYCVRYGMLLRVVEETDVRKAAFKRALEIHAHGLMFETLEIADTTQIGETVKVKGDGTEEVTRGDMTDHRKMRIAQRNKLAAVWNRPVYGEKVDVNVSSVGLDTLLSQVDEARKARALPKPDEPRVMEGEATVIREPQVV